MPLKHTELGKTIHDALFEDALQDMINNGDMDRWAPFDGFWSGEDLGGIHLFDIQAATFRLAEKWEPNEKMKVRIKDIMYEHGLLDDQFIRQALGVSLRDWLLAKREQS